MPPTAGDLARQRRVLARRAYNQTESRAALAVAARQVGMFYGPAECRPHEADTIRQRLGDVDPHAEPDPQTGLRRRLETVCVRYTLTTNRAALEYSL